MELKNMKFLAKGHRSVVFTARYKGKIAAIKKRKENIGVSQHILNEGKMLEILNRHGIGPRLYYYDEEKVVMEYVKGNRILEWLDKNKKNKTKIRNAVNEILRQARIIDRLKIEKREMHKPVKHILMGRKVTLIDFERAKKSIKPGNVTQLCQFLIRLRLMKKDIEALRKYKNEQTEKNFNALKKLVF